MPLHAGSGMRVTEDTILAAIRDWYDPSVNQASLDNGVVVPNLARAIGTYTFPTTGALIPPMWARGIVVYLNVTAITATGTVTLTIQGVEPTIQTAVYTVLASAAIGAVGLTVLRVYPGIAVTANVTANDIIPAQLSLKAVVATAGPMTFSAAFSYEP